MVQESYGHTKIHVQSHSPSNSSDSDLVFSHSCPGGQLLMTKVNETTERCELISYLIWVGP